MNNLNTLTITTLLIAGSVNFGNSEPIFENTTVPNNSNSYSFDISSAKRIKSENDEDNPSNANNVLDNGTATSLISDVGSIELIGNFAAEKITIVETAPISAEKLGVNHQYPVYHYENFMTLTKAFDKEYEKNKLLLKTDEFNAENKFLQTSFRISELNFNKSAIEILPDSFKFSLMFPEDKLLLISKSIIPLNDLKENQIVYSYFINKKRISSDVIELDSFVDGFKEYLSL